MNVNRPGEIFRGRYEEEEGWTKAGWDNSKRRPAGQEVTLLIGAELNSVKAGIPTAAGFR
ncbi:hypothetical protein [Candidatus Thiosymbion oneisti]|uniref:hypothetical protein n=1 Tax=Candidatus Thiosymbion oneisti TaxID=589554 RepID=UPI00105E34D2|nr:hypothetical protein [Candidatus Thiosymbion oneisti]